MIACAFILISQLAGSDFLPADIPNVRCVLPTQVPGSYIVAEELDYDYRWHWRPKRSDRPPIKADSGWPNISDERNSKYGFTDVNPLGAFDLEKWEYRQTDYDSVGWNRGREMRIVLDPQTERQRLLIGKSRVQVPNGRTVLMFSSDGRFLVTERAGTRTRHPESKYYFKLDLYAIEGLKLRPIKSLGEVWFDGGSTGIPAFLAVSGSGLVVYDVPGGGGVLRRPYLVGADGLQRHIGGLGDNGAMVFFDGPPIPFKEGILMPIEVVEPTGMQGDAETPEYTRTNWIVWYSKAGAWGSATPAGFVNAFKASPMSAVLAIKAKAGIELRRLALPPTGWRRLQTPIAEPIQFGP